MPVWTSCSTGRGPCVLLAMTHRCARARRLTNATHAVMRVTVAHNGEWLNLVCVFVYMACVLASMHYVHQAVASVKQIKGSNPWHFFISHCQARDVAPPSTLPSRGGNVMSLCTVLCRGRTIACDCWKSREIARFLITFESSARDHYITILTKVWRS